uniref:Heat shock protein 75 kDa, mitochondrial n=1 Tax=Acrobeloides nanus TaxID=290746 RepID=A0A914C2X2_9BILA
MLRSRLKPSLLRLVLRNPVLITEKSFHTTYSNKKTESFEFQAETKSLLDIVARSLYSNSEVFIRELISNANDALEKRRCIELSQEAGTSSDVPYEIRVTTDEAANKIVFEDTGIGMNREELIDLLGTIAKSGSKEFRNQNIDSQTAESIIGQFGVGFYSAFMVADKIVLKTKKQDSVGYTWLWNGSSAYEIAENEETTVGTRIEIYLKPGDAAEFSRRQKVIDIINKYSYFVTVPIILNGDRVNTLNAIWTMNTNEVTQEMHETFFKQLAKTHHPTLVDDRPQYIIHYKADAPIHLRSLLYIPAHKVSQLEFTAEAADSGISLYARRVLIKAHAKELLPRYLRFLVGVVDSEDIPLNLSREMLQNDLVIIKLRRILTDKVISYLLNQMKKDRIKYLEFYQGYSAFFKEGVLLEQDQTIKEEISKMLLFESSNFKPGVYTSLSEYVERMQKDQKNIYYLFAPSRNLAETSPYFELFKKKNWEVLFITDPADEMVLLFMLQFQLKNIESVENWLKNEGVETVEHEKELTRDTNKKEFLTWVKSNLGSVKVNDIKPSSQASDHPFIITVAAEPGVARHLMRLGQIKDKEHLVMLKPVLHVNFNHPAITGLMKRRKHDESLSVKVIEQLYDNALITSGLLKDPSQMVPRLNQILGELLQGEKSTILVP